ncbi:hypothetical protein AB0L74_28760 [Streptomyces sp. NPDC052020]|uniref:hypothetical protein n=1 Tax=Streptomyces sp. NPDC052020 TaxID=3155677 RepID=UPI003423CE12
MATVLALSGSPSQRPVPRSWPSTPPRTSGPAATGPTYSPRAACPRHRCSPRSAPRSPRGRFVLGRHSTTSPDGAMALAHDAERQLAHIIGHFVRALPFRAHLNAA